MAESGDRKQKPEQKQDDPEKGYEEELAGYLQQRIKPGLNSGAIPLLARSIAKDIAHREHPNGGQAASVAQESQSAEAVAAADFEAEMHDLQAELGEDWVLSFSVHGEDGWLTAAKKDGSQHVEAETAEVLSEVVARLNEGGRGAG